MPPCRRAVHGLVAYLTALLLLLTAICCLHVELCAAIQTQRTNPAPPTADPIDVTLAQGKQLRDNGHTQEAIAAFTRAVKISHSEKDLSRESKSLILLSSAQIVAFQYKAALDTLQTASSIAESLNDPRLNGSVCGNLATIYSQMGDWAEADLQSEHAISFFKQISNPDEIAKILLVRALQKHADMCFRLGKYSEGYRDSAEAVSRATELSDKSQLATILDMRGAALVHQGKLDVADEALKTSLSLSEKSANKDGLAFSKEHLAELELEKPNPNLALALRLIDEAFGTASPAFRLGPQYYPIHIRARILLESGKQSAALAEFMRAVDAANQWRAGALPSDTTNSQTVAALQEVYADYAQLAAEIALGTNDNSLAVSGLEVLAENRAAGLREQLRRVYTSSFRLPDEYYFKLAQLQSAQAEVTLGRNNGQDKAQLSRIRLEISDLENKTGLKLEKALVPKERIPRRNSLRDIQRTLSPDQVLISITMGKRRSYLWAVTGQKVSLSGLPGEEELTSDADLFATAVRNGRASPSSASALTRALFSGLPADVWNRSEWMIVADGPLLNGIPFCALTNLASAKRLIDTISLRFLPSELLLLDRQPANAKEAVARHFIGVGDPIYNQADARLGHSHLADAKSVSDSVSLARLLGSDKEIHSAAQQCRASDPVFLTGPEAARENLAAALAHPPGILHFAVHVVSPPHEPQQAALALSIKNGIPELLTPEVVASFHTPGCLVVLSGCSSGQGKVLPGVGLVGLSRAWLLAGASAVVVSSWPTPDDSGRFFSSFYGHFNRIQSGDIAQRSALALRQTQLDMLNGSGYQTSPSFWGAFAVITKE